MMIKIVKAINFIFIASIFLVSCQFTYTSLEYEKAAKALKAKNHQKALKHFKRVIQREPETETAIKAAKEASSVALLEIKNYQQAIFFLNHIIKYSKSEEDRIYAQKLIATIYFENLIDYKMAIKEFSRLLNSLKSKEEIIDIKFSLAKAYFYTNQFYQAEVEVKSLIKNSSTIKYRTFELKQFLANIYFTIKKMDEAILIYEELLHDFPDKSRRENIPMSIVVCLEELKQYEKAIEKLKGMRTSYSVPEFIDFKINRLNERKQNLPGRRKR